MSDDLDRRVAEIIDKHTPDGDYLSHEIALEVLDHMRENEADLLLAWADVLAFREIVGALRRRRSSIRAAALTAARRADGLASVLDVREQVDDQHRMRRLGEMVRPDVLAAAGYYRRRADSNLLRAVRLEALADALPDDSTPVSTLGEEEVRRLLGN